MKIAYCIPGIYNPGGMERVLATKVNYLVAKAGYDITIITTERGDKPYFELDGRVKLVNFSLNFNAHYNLPLLKKSWLHYRLLRCYKRKLEKFLNENHIDICVSMCGKEIEFLSRLKCNCIKIAEFHSMLDYRAKILSSQYGRMMGNLLGRYLTQDFIRSTKKLTRFVVLTQEDATRWKKTNSNIVQIYNPCGIVSKGVPALSEKKFVTVGRLDEGKGYDYLIRAWELVNRRYPDWIIDIFGQGEWHEKLQKEIQDKNLSSVVHLRGITKDVATEFYNSSGYVMTSRYEGFPMVLIEAGMCGLPLVSFDCKTGPREIIVEGENGFLVPVGDVSLLADRICQLIEFRELRVSMGDNAMRFAQRFTLDKIMSKWIQLFENL